MAGGINRRKFLELTAAAGTSLVLNSAFANNSESRPNILYILADDMGHADLGCYGSRAIATPNIDRLAREGLKFSQAYANSCVCSPSRLALITGRYPGRLEAGLDEPIANNPVGLSPTHPTLPSILKKAGYRTSLIGKWHLGELPEYGPLKSGYDHFFGIHSGGTDYFNHEFHWQDKKLGQLFSDEKPTREIGYMTYLLGQHAEKEINLAAKDPRPFMMSLHFTAPHWPWEGPEDQAIAKSIGDIRHYDGGNIKTYATMLETMDTVIGNLLQQLAELGVAENTLVIFSSDNGGERFSDTWPLIGMKGELLEGGIRVPLIMRWPRQIKANSDSTQVISLMDLMPTLLAASGLTPAANYPSDGENLLPVIVDEAKPQPRRLFWRHNAHQQLALREGDWKYLKIEGNEFLFNLHNDERERANLKQQQPERLAEMRHAAEQWQQSQLAYRDNNYSLDLHANQYAEHY